MNKHYITNFLNQNIDPKFIEKPNIDENLLIIDNIIQKIIDIDNKFDLYFHKLHRKGMLYLINELKIYLNYIPTNILRNEFSPINNYIEITNYIANNYKLFDPNKTQNNIVEKDNCIKKQKTIELLGKEYLKSLTILNYFINLESNAKKGIKNEY